MKFYVRREKIDYLKSVIINAYENVGLTPPEPDEIEVSNDGGIFYTTNQTLPKSVFVRVAYRLNSNGFKHGVVKKDPDGLFSPIKKQSNIQPPKQHHQQISNAA